MKFGDEYDTALFQPESPVTPWSVEYVGNVPSPRYTWATIGENTYESINGLNRIVDTNSGVVRRPAVTVPYGDSIPTYALRENIVSPVKRP